MKPMHFVTSNLKHWNEMSQAFFDYSNNPGHLADGNIEIYSNVLN